MNNSNSSLSNSDQNLPSLNTLRDVYTDKQVGECFDFGRYPQGANGEVKPITWRVLQRVADHLLVITEQILDCRPYHEERCDITWEACTLRRWLNSEFYNKAFNAQEHKCILKTEIVNDEGPNTEDYLFLLSVDEAKTLFANDIERNAKPTEYAIKRGVFFTDDSCSYWWLRSRGVIADGAPFVSIDGIVRDDGLLVDSCSIAVRPVFRIVL